MRVACLAASVHPSTCNLHPPGCQPSSAAGLLMTGRLPSGPSCAQGVRELCRAVAAAPGLRRLALAATGADDTAAEALARALTPTLPVPGAWRVVDGFADRYARGKLGNLRYCPGVLTVCVSGCVCINASPCQGLQRWPHIRDWADSTRATACAPPHLPPQPPPRPPPLRRWTCRTTGWGRAALRRWLPPPAAPPAAWPTWTWGGTPRSGRQVGTHSVC